MKKVRILLLILIPAVVVLRMQRHLRRLYAVVTLFEPKNMSRNFRSMNVALPASTVKKGDNTWHFGRGKPFTLPETYPLDNQPQDTARLLDESGLDALLIVKGDNIIHEQYRPGYDETTQHISWSVAKSFVSALIGIAVEEKRFDIEEPITQYVPELIGSGYDNVRIKDILQMSSGVRFDEDYGAFGSDINRFSRVMALGGSLDHFATTLEREREPGTYLHYVSIDTQVLCMLLARTTGKPLTQLLREQIWEPLGMESDAYWTTDDKGVELGLGGLNAVLRDYARFGRLYANHGNWNGKQIVPAAWVNVSTTPDAPHLTPGPRDTSEEVWGYGYQWWVPENPDGEFLAAGIYSQFIYVNQTTSVVVVKLSSNPEYNDETRRWPDHHINFFRAISDALS